MTSQVNASAHQVQDFSRLVNPRAVAVIGASNDLTRIGGQPIKLLTEYGFKGKVYPVNPKYTEIKGLPCYKDIASLPKPCDVALVALSSNHVLGVVEQLGAAGIPFAIVLSAGFSEIGGEGIELQKKLIETAKRAGVRLIGPNCLGMINLHDNTRIGFGGTVMLKTLIPGPCAMVTQSGGFGFGVVSTAAYYGVGFNYAVSTGNEADISLLELAEFFLEQPENDSVMLFMEGITDGRRLIALGQRALELKKPVLIWKVGNTDVGRKAAASHTARMTASYELFQSAFKSGGFIEVRDMDDLIDLMKALRSKRSPRGNRVGVITLSGGAGVLLADRCIEHGLDLPKLTDETTAKLREVVVSYASVANPVDATANGYNDNFASYNRVIEAVLNDPNVDQVIVRSPRGTAAPAWSKAFLEVISKSDKPVIINWPTSPDDNADVMEFLEGNGVACILSPGRTVRALASLNEFAVKSRAGRQAAGPGRTVAAQSIDIPASSGTLGEHRSKEILSAYGIPTVHEVVLSSAAVEMLSSAPLPFPLAVKIESGDIPHKTEAGVVRLNINSLEELKSAAREVYAAAQHYDAKARIDGILIQEMASGLEVIAGAVNDRFFGPVVVFGLGGIYTELLKDVTRRFAPFDLATAREMIEEIKGAALLKGFRGQPALDVDALADALARLSWLVADHKDRIAEVDINPLFVRTAGQGVAAADGLIVLKDK